MSTETALKEKVFQYAKELGYGELHIKMDQKTGLFAIIAIHSTTLGPALGGCRCIPYSSTNAAIRDALRLAQSMTYKAAITGLPLGGGKSVLIKPDNIADRQTYFEIFGQFIETLGGRYITAMDSGTNPEDMDAIAKHTKHVTGKSSNYGDPSPFTARGVFRAIQAAIQYKLGKESLQGLHIAIQGAGHVGFYLAQELHKLGVKLTMTDINEKTLQRCVEQFNATVVKPDEIYGVECDLFAPCALGAIINDDTIPQFKTEIIVGAANNQLAEPRHGQILLERGILYGPDYVVNAGGLVCACAEYLHTPLDEIHRQADRIYDTSLAIFDRAEKADRPTSIVADEIAEEKINAGG